MSDTKGHPHAALMLQYARDAAEHAEPWLLWEHWLGDDGWSQCSSPIQFFAHIEYRRKLRTIRIGERDVPEPLRVAPATDADYWIPNAAADELVFGPITWDGSNYDMRQLSRGFVHLSPEAAQAHAEALIALTAQVPHD